MQDYEQCIRGAEAKHAELARQLESAKAADHHARIMELQVQLKGLLQHPSPLRC